MALPAVRSVGTVANGIGTISPGLPSGWAVGDILLLFIETGNQALTPPTGWNQAPDSPVQMATAQATRLHVWWRRARAQNNAITVPDSGDHQIARMIAVSGAIQFGDPFDVTSSSTEATSDTSVSITGDTTTGADRLCFAAVATGTDASTTTGIGSWTNASLANLTERIDNWTTDGNGGGLGVASGEKASAGAVSATTATLAATPGAGTKAMWFGAIEPAIAVTDYPSYVKSLFPTDYYRLGENSGTVAANECAGGTDPSANGTYVGSPVLNVTGAIATADDGAVRLDGGDDAVNPSSIKFPVGDQSTIVAWIWRDDYLSWSPIVGAYSAGYDLALTNGSETVTLYGPSGAQLAHWTGTDGVPVMSTPNQFHLVVCTLDQVNNLSHLWVDNIDCGADTLSEDGSNSVNHAIGYDIAGTEFAEGAMDEVSVHGWLLTSTEIAALWAYRAGAGDTETVGPIGDSATPSDAITKTFGKKPADSVTPSDSITTKAVGKAIADTATPSDAQAKAVSKALADTATPSDAVGKALVKNIADAVTPSDQLVSESEILLGISDSATPTDSIGKAVGISKAGDSASVSDEISKGIGPHPADTVAVDDAATRAIGKGIAETPTVADSVAKAVAHPLADSATPSDAVSKGPGISQADSATPSDAISKAYGMNRDEPITPTDLIEQSGGFHVGIPDSVSLDDAISKKPTIGVDDTTITIEGLAKGETAHLADSVTPSDAVTRGVGKVFADSASPADAVAKAVVLGTIADSADLADALSRGIGVRPADTLSLADQIAKAVVLARAETPGLADELTGVDAGGGLSRQIDDDLSLSDSITLEWVAHLSFDDSATPTDALARSVGKGISDTAGVADQLARSFGLVRADSAALTDAVAKSIAVVRGDLLSLVDEVTLPLSQHREVNLDDSVAVADLLAREWVARRGIDDSVGVGDEIRRAVVKLLVEAVELNDQASPSHGWRIAVQDGFDLDDLTSNQRGIRRLITDSAGVADALERSFAKVLADAVDLDDEVYSPTGIPGWRLHESTGAIVPDVPGHRGTGRSGRLGTVSPGHRANYRRPGRTDR